MIRFQFCKRSLGAWALCLMLSCGARIEGGDSNSNWLHSCDPSIECGAELACICGICTRRCNTDVGCAGGRERAVCAADGAEDCKDSTAICVPALTTDAEVSSATPVKTSGQGAGATPGASRTAVCGANACQDSYGCSEASGLRCTCPASSLAQCAEGAFQVLPLAADMTSCGAMGLSPDGSAVTGSCLPKLPMDNGSGVTFPDQVLAMRWPAQGALANLKPQLTLQSEGQNTVVINLSDDGTKVLWSRDNDTTSDYFLTDVASGTVQAIDGNLLGLASTFQIFPLRMTGDGNVVVGMAESYSSSGDPSGTTFQEVSGFRWTVASNTVERTNSGAFDGVNPGPDALAVSVNGMSSDSKVLVGSANGQPMSWRAQSGVQLLPVPSGLNGGYAALANADGSVIVGMAVLGGIDAQSSHPKLVRWVDGVVTAVVEFDGNADPMTISPDGVRIFGTTIADGGLTKGESDPWVWDEVNGVRSLKTVLGLDAIWGRGWVKAVAADGVTIAGTIQLGHEATPTALRAFRARLPAL